MRQDAPAAQTGGATAPPLNVLILERFAADAEAMVRALVSGGITALTHRVQDRDEFLRALESERPDVVLANTSLPDFDGLAALKLVRTNHPHIPVIVVTGTLSDELASGMLREGAADYILKDRMWRLPAAVQHAVERARNQVAAREAEEKYRALFTEARDGIALTDTATGHIVDCNPQFERQTGRTREQLAAMAFWNLQADGNGPEEAYRRFLTMPEATGTHDFEFTIGRPDGSRVPLECRARTFTLRGRQYVQTLAQDVSERQASEALLRRQVEELRRFQRVAVDRELRLEELERELARLLRAAPR